MSSFFFALYNLKYIAELTNMNLSYIVVINSAHSQTIAIKDRTNNLVYQTITGLITTMICQITVYTYELHIIQHE